MSALNTWPAPVAWIYGFVDTSVPGYRKLSNNGTAVQLADGYYSFPAYVDELNTRMGGVGGSATTDAIGRVTINGAAPITWTDRLGWMIGLDVVPGDTSGSNSTRTSDRPPPAAVPLLNASWSRIDRDVETSIAVDRRLRGHGYLFGDSELIRFTLLMHAQGYRAFRAGWVLAGQACISIKAASAFSTDTPWSTSNPDGYVQGYVIGTEGGRWVDPTRTIWRTSLIMAQV